MKQAKITIVQRGREAGSCLPALLSATGVAFREIDIAELVKWPALSDNEIVILDVSADRWGLTAAYQLRTRGSRFFGPIVIGSFERKDDLARTPDGDILSIPGVTFVRLPVPPACFHTILSTIALPDSVAVDLAVDNLFRHRMATLARTLTHKRGARIGPIRLQLCQVLDAISLGEAIAGAAIFHDCLQRTADLPDWAIRCDAVLREASEFCEGKIVRVEILPLVKELLRTLGQPSVGRCATTTIERLSLRALDLIDSIDRASGALDAFLIPRE